MLRLQLRLTRLICAWVKLLSKVMGVLALPQMTGANQPLPRDFYSRNTLLVARDLIGMHLVHVMDDRRRVGRIVETEAYKGPQDLAAHSARGYTARNAVM